MPGRPRSPLWPGGAGWESNEAGTRSQVGVGPAGCTVEQAQPHPRPLDGPATVAKASLADVDGGLSGLVVARQQCRHAQPDDGDLDRHESGRLTSSRVRSMHRRRSPVGRREGTRVVGLVLQERAPAARGQDLIGVEV
jgi:hypothetical protein